MIKNFKLKIKNYLDFILDLVFPKYCVGCHKEGFWLCDKCKKKIILINSCFCPECNHLTPKGQFCPRCRTKSQLVGVVIATHYKEGPLKEAIHTYKYDGIFDLKHDLSQFLIKALNIRAFKGNWFLIPVPLHKSKLGQRGFNQSQLLSEEIIATMPNFSIINNKLIKIKASTTQVQMVSRSKRLRNPKNSFAWVGRKNELKGKKIVLVDDIYTTGATLQECARILRRDAGATVIWGLVLAKG